MESRRLRFEQLDARVMLDASGIAHHIVTFNTSLGSFQVELSDNATPLTVANFLNYVQGGDLNDTFVHRSVNNFVIQGGGYAYGGTSLTPQQLASTPHIATDPAIVNEASRSNLRGTIAMARTSAPDSATSEWFINLKDNSLSLDKTATSAGYAVFGDVLGDGMQVVDAIAALNRFRFGGAFGEMPLRNRTASDLTSAITANQVVVVNSISAVSGSVQGSLYADQNNNGQRDAPEGGLNNWTVFVDNNNNGALDVGEQSTNTGAGGNYALNGIQFGTFTVRALVQPGSFAKAPATAARSVTFTSDGQTVTGQDFGIVQVVVPSLPVLAAGQDHGASSTDNVTNLSALQFVVANVVPGASVKLYDGSGTTPISSMVATSTSVTFNVTLAEGVHAIRAEQTLQGIDSGKTAATTVTVDTTARVIDVIPNQAKNVGDTLTLNIVSTEEGNDGAKYITVNKPSGMTIDESTGAISFTPTDQDVGHHAVTVQAVDLAGNSTTLSFDVAVNGRPLLPPIPNKTVNRGTLLSIIVTANDVDVLDFELLPVGTNDFPTDATIARQLGSDTTAVFQWTPDAALGAGTFHVTVRVSDPGGLDAFQTFQITVNAPPELTAIDDQAIDELSPLSFSAEATDQDAPTYALVPVAGQAFPTGATIDPTTGEFQWTPTEAQGEGVYRVTVKATDNGGLSDSRTIEITVAEVNEAPVLPPIANKTVNQGDALNFTAVATDADLPTQSLLYSLGPDAPAGAQIDPQSGKFSWQVSDAQSAGTFHVTILVSEDNGQTFGASQTFDVEVIANTTDDTVGFAFFGTLPFNGGATGSGPIGTLLARDAAFSATAPGPLFGGFTTNSGFESFGDANSTTGRLPSGINNSLLGADTGVPHALEELLAEMGLDAGEVEQTGGKKDGKRKGKVKPAVNFEPPADGSNNGADQDNEAQNNGGQDAGAQNGQSSGKPPVRVSRRNGNSANRSAGNPSADGTQPAPDASSRIDRQGIWVPQIGYVQARASASRVTLATGEHAARDSQQNKSRQGDSAQDRGEQIAKAALFMPLVVSQLPKENQAKRSFKPKQRS